MQFSGNHFSRSCRILEKGSSADGHLCPVSALTFRRRTEPATLLLLHSIQNHACQVHALGHHGRQARRSAADIRVPSQTNGRNDGGGNDQSRLHPCLFLHLLRPGSRSRAIASFISPIRAPPVAPVCGRVCTRDCHGRSPMEGSFSALRRAGTGLQFNRPAGSLPALGYSPRTSCSGS